MSKFQQARFFDFDGVLADTSLAKAELFISLLHNLSAEETEAVQLYCLEEGGIPRTEKFVHIFREILKRPLPESNLNDLVAQFTELVVDSVLAAPHVPGAYEAISQSPNSQIQFVISGTPHQEMISICDARKISRFFSAVCGSPRTKTDWIEKIISEHNLVREQAVMIGDSMTDLKAARETEIAFLGVDQHGLNILPSSEIIVSDLSNLDASIEKALSHHALAINS